MQRWHKDRKWGDKCSASRAKPGVEMEAHGPNGRVQAQPAGGSTAQPQSTVTLCKCRLGRIRFSNILRKARKQDFDLKSHLL